MGLDPKLLEYADGIIRYKARQLTRKPGFGSYDREDIEHEFLIDIFERWPAFDSSRASARTFVARIIENKAASLVRECQATKRGAGRCTQANGDATNGTDDFDEEQVRARRGFHSRPTIEALSLRLDVASVMADLPHDLRCLCERLMRGSISNAARSSGRHRATLHRAIRKLRKRFSDAGIQKYL